jgi:hypothetical protein
VHDVTTAERSEDRARPTVRRPRQVWTRAVPVLARHVARTTPWITLLVGCASGTAVLAVLAHVDQGSPLSQNTVRATFLPAVAALAFVPHVYFRPVIQATRVPSWTAATGQTLLALPVLALTCWVQLRLMTSTYPAGSAGHIAAVYPLLAQFAGWSMITVAIAACCERSRYAALSGAIAVPVSFTIIAAATFTAAIARHLVTPPATARAATIAWYAIAAGALAVTCLALRDQWQRYTRKLHL